MCGRTCIPCVSSVVLYLSYQLSPSLHLSACTCYDAMLCRRHGDKPVTLSELGQRVPRPHGVDKVGAFCAERHNIFEVDGPYVFLVEDDIA